MIRSFSKYIFDHWYKQNSEMSSKYFKNCYEDFTKGESILSNNMIRKDSKISLGLMEKWQSTVRQLDNLDFSDYSVYTGTSGIALLKLKKDPEDKNNLKEVENLLSLHKLKNRRHSFLCGDPGPLSIGIIVNHKLGKEKEVKQLVARLKLLDKDVIDTHSDLPNEYLYGRAGYLFSILFVNKYVSPPPFDGSFIRKIIDAILICGQNLSKAGNFKCPLMYQWHDSYYLGAAHGLSGILYLLLQARQYLTEEDLNCTIKPTVDYLLKQRFPSGNFPSSLGRDNDKYVQWCHGAPGFLYLFTSAYKLWQDPIYLKVALECGDVIWEQGLLKKGYSLCHGVSGNAYCFLELFQTTKEEKHLYRATKFAEWCLDYSREHEKYPPDRPLSLYEGIAGPMYLILDIQKPYEAKFPGFTL
ncbi:glutathione S-transferase LANCL1 [Leptinotarsa decemlineata]|uniref:glutathione S-transferase LANCL1 n=1 Tax=Leptinotarsa decemlineata TaxID=7539 RepID=UPI003D307619